jgi:hypothetical protein
LITVVGIDPGKNIGFARIDAEDKKIQFQFDKIVDWKLFSLMIEQISILAREERTEDNPLILVVEKFRLFGHLAGKQIGSEMDASQVIGVCRYLAAASKGHIKLVMQEPSINETAAKWSGRGTEIVKKKGHLPDNVSAFNHAYYWLIQNQHLRHRVLDA